MRLGWIFSAFLVAYAAFQIPAGILARRLGPRRVLLFAGVWWAAFTALTAVLPPGFRHAVPLLITVRFALGAGEATMYPAASQFVERWFPVAERGKANGIIFGGVGLGSGLTPYFVTLIILHLGWRASFWVGVHAQALMTDDPRYTIPPYMGHNGWIALDINKKHNERELQSLALESYRHFASKRMLAKLPQA